ncbi:MAG TPA: hypothetical protein DDX47_00370 [Candidatus Jacksonbacteria bacterium]|nr:MAG: hypothetical protein UW45_C0005G0003 [Parcubacteria group bacterium GW2011_GWC2_44_22]OGY76476.1 MAG: hypothetical protein A2295_02385 [Candidatus Jacksonbacteria bacterium RIFOXYB2_FULL_44_15]OGY76847.1 MAG: hypothetical protein A2240_04720 [Candidatus Jacksonbacteria bacterium RIFOXYA2_FULL_43_12]OGY82206.1 MAG: hypothetical protein A2550_05890 [Candidatus Jacksonbacteria bacterium RIFOXYD2_FULL_43_21]HBH45810.1 hypothetical protein [Candidatus Jacksonbacteria bacterium]
MTQSNYEEINLADYIRTLLIHWKLITAVTLVLMLLGLIINNSQWEAVTSTYQSTGTIKIGQINGALIDPDGSEAKKLLTLDTASDILQKLNPSANTPGQTATEQLLSRTNISSAGSPNNFLTVTYQDQNPKRAWQVTNAWLSAILENQQGLYKQQDLIRTAKINELNRQLTLLTARLEKIENIFDAVLTSSPTINLKTDSGILSEILALRTAIVTKIDANDQEISNYRLNRLSDSQSQIISLPLLPDTPLPTVGQVAPLLVLSIFAGIGLLLGALAALIVEWWKKNMIKLKSA